MELEIWQAEEVTRKELAQGNWSVGGGAYDEVQLPGVSPGLLRLGVDAGQLTIEASVAVEVDGVPFPSWIPRLLLPGENLLLPGGFRLRRPPLPKEPEAGTAQFLRQLLLDGAEPDQTRAAHLVCLTGLDAGRVFPLACASVELGRGAAAPIRIRDRAVSRRHARIRHTQAGYLLEELGGPNGVYVDGAKVRGKAALAEGATVELGRTVLRFHAPSTPAPPPPEPEVPAQEVSQSVPLAVPKAVPQEVLQDVPKALAAQADQSAGSGLAGSTSVSEWLLIAAGATLALTGLVVSWGLA